MSTHRKKYLAVLAVFVLAIGIATGYLINNLQKRDTSNAQNGTTTEWKEPPALTSVLNTKEDYLNDLRSLGCGLVEVGGSGWYGGMDNTAKSYTELRRLAFNSKVVFYYTHENNVRLMVLFQGYVVECLAP